jgi:chaperonin GroES
MQDSITPLYDRIIVKPLEESSMLPNGIVLPDSGKEKPSKGTVISVGVGRIQDDKIVPLIVKENDIVMYGKFSGTEVQIEGEEYLIMRESDIFGIINKKT